MASIISSDSFTSSALAQNKVTVKHYISTKIFLSGGEEVLTYDIGTDIYAIFHLSITGYKNDKAGDVETSDGYIMVGPSTSIKKNDLIEFDSKKYILFNVRERGPSGDTHFYTYAQINLYEIVESNATGGEEAPEI